MSDICQACGEPKYSWTIYRGEKICMDCADKLKKEEILNQGSSSDSPRFFKEWSNKDRATAFFEALGRYLQSPNGRDYQTIIHIWHWAAHADHALITTMNYTFKWVKFDINIEGAKWK